MMMMMIMRLFFNRLKFNTWNFAGKRNALLCVWYVGEYRFCVKCYVFRLCPSFPQVRVPMVLYLVVCPPGEVLCYLSPPARTNTICLNVLSYTLLSVAWFQTIQTILWNMLVYLTLEQIQYAYAVCSNEYNMLTTVQSVTVVFLLPSSWRRYYLHGNIRDNFLINCFLNFSPSHNHHQQYQYSPLKS